MAKVFLNALPKSGTNLVAKLLDLFQFDQKGFLGSQRYLRGTVKSTFHRFKEVAKGESGYLIGIDSPINVKKSVINKRLDKLGNREYMIAHVGYTDALLNHVIQLGFKPILVTRDPRAVLNSYVHYVNTSQVHPLNRFFSGLSKIEQFEHGLDGFSNSDHSLNSLQARCDSVNVWVNSPEVLKVRFEDLIGSQGGGSDDSQERVLNELASFLGLVGFDCSLIKKALFGEGRHTYRKGLIDSWKQEIPTEIQNRLTSDLSSTLKEWKYL